MSPTYDMSKITSRQEEIPNSWIFFYFASLHGRRMNENYFDGRSIRISSFWNKDSTPSLYFFCSDGQYHFKCFSSGKGGNSISFVKELENLEDDKVAVDLIKEEYIKFKASGGRWTTRMVERIYLGKDIATKCEYKKIPWTDMHLKYFLDYHITPETLMKYNVSPISGYNLMVRGVLRSFVTSMAFVFENRKGGYQIYQPETKPKYITIMNDYYPGWDQISSPYKSSLAILSGLKDIMAFDELKLNVDLISGRSESHMIDEVTMKTSKHIYKHLFAIGDYDAAGIAMMNRYEKLYGVHKVIIPEEKDVAEFLKQHGKDFAKDRYALLMDRLINKNESKTLFNEG